MCIGEELEYGVIQMRRLVFGVMMSMVIGGLTFIGTFQHPFAFIFTVYALPFILFFGIPVARIAHKLVEHEKQCPAAKRLFIYLVMGAWLPLIHFTTIFLTQEVYDGELAGVGFIIVVFMVFAFCFWLGEELFERTKLKEWTEPDLSST